MTSSRYVLLLGSVLFFSPSFVIHVPDRARALAAEAAAPSFSLEDGERVVLLGATFFERAIRYGYLETALARRWPDRDIIFRNLAWSGDTVFGESWTYSESHSGHRNVHDRFFELVAAEEPTTIIASYGAVESFAGTEGVERFRGGLDRFLDRIEETGARVVLLSPLPFEPHPAQDVAPQNALLAKYVAVLRGAAAERQHLFVDLFDRLRGVLDGRTPWTVNGVHLSEEGYRLLVHHVEDAFGLPPLEWSVDVDSQALSASGTGARAGEVENVGGPLRFRIADEHLPTPSLPSKSHDPALPTSATPQRLLRITGLEEGDYTLSIDGEKRITASHDVWTHGVAIDGGPAFARAEELRRTIVEKNRLFFNHWRPQNETYLSGFRRDEQGRNVVELPLFDPLIVAQESRIRELRTPRTHYYHLRKVKAPSGRGAADMPETDPAVELESMRVAAGFEIELFASEPLVRNPINMSWDARGRLWVASSPIYPQIEPGQRPNDRIDILEDTDGDGRADKHTVFADGLMVPTSVLPGDGGAYVANSTELLHLRDTNGDDRADETRVLLSGFGTEDTHQILHALTWGPDGHLYFNQSVLIYSHVETLWGPRRLPGGGVWKYRPETGRLEVYARGMINPWGLRFDRWGQSFATDGAYGEGINYVFPDAAFYMARGAKRILRGLNPGQPKECGLEILSGRHVADSWRGRMVTADFRAHRVVSFEVTDESSGYFSRQREDLVTSNHRAFRPVDIKMGPDGAVYICDWYNPIINHGEVDFRDPRRDHAHGRIWRMTAKGRAPLTPPALRDATVAELVEALAAPEPWTREQARQQLKTHGAQAAVPALKQWLDGLRGSDSETERLRLEALWTMATLRHSEPPLLMQLLASPEYRVRAAAVRVLSHGISDGGMPIETSLPLLEKAVSDPAPRVRLEAVNALRAVDTAKAVEVALRALGHPVDSNVDFALWTTARDLESRWLDAFLDGELDFEGDTRRAEFALKAVGSDRAVEPLVEELARGGTDAAREEEIARLIASIGLPDQLRALFDRAREAPRDRRPILLAALEEAARTRSAHPSGDLSGIRSWLTSDASAIRLAGQWKVESARAELEVLASGTSTTFSEAHRLAAIEGLGYLGGAPSVRVLENVVSAEEPLPIRVRAVSALSGVDLPAAAKSATHVLTSVTSGESDIRSVYRSFLERQGGSAALAAALQDVTVPKTIASLGLSEAMSTPGDHRTLVAALAAAGGIDEPDVTIDPAKLAKTVAAVERAGDPALGEALYRRADLKCESCHAIGGAGGQVGPDLMSLGASAPLDYIVESLLDPNRRIKEGYDTTTVILKDGRIVSGLAVADEGDSLTLRTADGSEVRVTAANVAQRSASAISMMPADLTALLDAPEQIHLARFLAELGKEGPYRVPDIAYVRTWSIRAGEEDDWKRAYSSVRGSLPLGDLQESANGSPQVVEVRFALEVTTPGEVVLRFEDPRGIQIRAGEAAAVAAGRHHVVKLDAGIQTVTLTVDLSKRDTPLTVEVENSPEHAGRARLVLGQ